MKRSVIIFTGCLAVMMGLVFTGNVMAATVQYTYDLSGRLVDTDYPDGAYVFTSYDQSGNIVSIHKVGTIEDGLIGDVYPDGVLSIVDAILSLQAAAGLDTTGIHLRGDINSDGHIDVIEAIYLLQSISEVRQ